MKIGRGLLLAVPLSLLLAGTAQAQVVISSFGCFGFTCFIPCVSCSLPGSWITAAQPGAFPADPLTIAFEGTLNFNSERTASYVNESPTSPTWQGVWSFSPWSPFHYLVTVFRYDGTTWQRVRIKANHFKDCNTLTGEYIVEQCTPTASNSCPKYAATWAPLGTRQNFFAYRLTFPHFP